MDNPYKNIPLIFLLTIERALTKDAEAWLKIGEVQTDPVQKNNCKENHDFYMEHVAMVRAAQE